LDGWALPRKVRRTEIVGAIFPVRRKHISSLFSRDRDIFLKFTKLSLERGSTIVFYVSGEKLLIGEAKVGDVKNLSPSAAWSHYGDRLFLDKEEYDKYVRISPTSMEERKMGEVTVFELKNMKKYETPVRATHPATPSGRYLTEEMIERIRNRTYV